MWPEESGPICLASAPDIDREGVADDVDQFGVDRGQVGPGPEERRVAGPEFGVGLHPAVHVLPLRGAAFGRERAQRVVEVLRLAGRLRHQGPEEVFLVGEVQVEGAVRRLGDLHHVVDPGGVVAPLVEGDHGRIEQLAHGAPALAAEDPLAGRGTDGVGVAGPARGDTSGRCPLGGAVVDRADPLAAAGLRAGLLRGGSPGQIALSAIPCPVNGNAGHGRNG